MVKEHLEKRFFVYFFALVQWLIYIAIVLPFFHHLAIVTGSKVNGAVKVIRPFHIWILSFSTILSLLFYKLRCKEENYIIVVSALTTLFSLVDFGLHFVHDFSLLMAFTRIITDGLYFALAAICTLKLILQVIHFLPYIFRRSSYIRKIKGHPLGRARNLIKKVSINVF